jgi:Flp pilus assembly protein TadG
MTTHRRSTDPALTSKRKRAHGQALVEFSLALIPFLLILMGIIDLGRGIYMSSGVTQAAREIARTTAVHPCNTGSCTLGNSAETQATIAAQRGLVPGLGGPASTITFVCTNISDVVESGTTCPPGKFIRITVSVPYAALTPVLSMVAPTTLVSTAHVEVP